MGLVRVSIATTSAESKSAEDTYILAVFSRGTEVHK